MITFQSLGRMGRIGNQMFQIASTIGIATRHGFDYGFPYWKNHDHVRRFHSAEDIDIQSWFKNPLPEMAQYDYQHRRIPWGYHELRIEDWTTLLGHMQSEKYFLHCQDIIRHYFEFKHETPLMPNTVAVHFRGCDYGGEYHPHCKSGYYQKALEIFKGKRVLVFSDEPDAALKVIGTGEAVRGNHSMVDLELMSRCSHHVIANSTFSWWAAWLSKGEVIAPKIWFGPVAGQDASDVYCKDWIVI